MLLNSYNISNLHTSNILYNRPEMRKMRQNLIEKKINKCIICNKIFPLCLLDGAHLKPRSIITVSERKNLDNLEFMCKCCHFLYDKGYIGIKNGYLEVSNDIRNYNLFNKKIKMIDVYNQYNMKYFDYHYKNIYKSKK
jgi:hypothetical protein